MNGVQKRNLWISLRYMVMLLFLGHEYSVSRLVNLQWTGTPTGVKFLYFLSLGSLIIIVSIGLLSHNLKAPTPKVIKKFFNSAIGSDPYTLILLIFFLLNLNWLSNSTFKLVADREIDAIATTELFYLSLAPLLAIITSWFLFPSSKRTSNEYLLFTGFSISKDTITLRNIDALLNPIMKSGFDIKEVIIVPSETIPKPADSFNDCKSGEEPEWYSANLNQIEQVYNRYREDYMKGADNEVNLVQSIIDIVLSPKRVNVILRNRINYDNFDKCSEGFRTAILEAESKHPEMQTALLITPGTKAVTAALTTFAVTGSRDILYVGQTSGGTIGKFKVNLKKMEPAVEEV